MDWSVFWTAVGGIAQAAAAVATFLAVVVALWLGLRDGRRSLQARYDDARPVLIIVSDPLTVGASSFIPLQQGNQSELDWSKQPHINVCNVGKGPALNIKSVIYGPEATAVPDAVSGNWSYRSVEKDSHWYHWTTDVVKPGESTKLTYDFAEAFGPATSSPKQTNISHPKTTNKNLYPSTYLNSHYNLPRKNQSAFAGSRLPTMTSFTVGMRAFMILFSVRGGK